MPASESSSTLVIIPAWNEAASIEATIADVTSAAPGMDIVVVDDGSADDTLRLARSCGVVVLPLTKIDLSAPASSHSSGVWRKITDVN